MAKIKKVRIKEYDDYYGDPIPLGADAKNIDMGNGNNLEEEVQSLKVYVENYLKKVLEGRY